MWELSFTVFQEQQVCRGAWRNTYQSLVVFQGDKKIPYFKQKTNIVPWIGEQ